MCEVELNTERLMTEFERIIREGVPEYLKESLKEFEARKSDSTLAPDPLIELRPAREIEEDWTWP